MSGAPARPGPRTRRTEAEYRAAAGADPMPAGDEAGMPPPARFPHLLYRIDDVRIALGTSDGDPAALDAPLPPDTEQTGRIRAILKRGQAGGQRQVAGVGLEAFERIAALGAQAPHLHELTDMVTRHAGAAWTIGTPMALPPVLLVGLPGVGKSWYLQRLAWALELPFRMQAMSATSLADTLVGSQGVWRNAREGLVARTLLQEPLSNPLVFVDEVDKMRVSGLEDPHRAFYTLLEPQVARRHVDEFLGFPMDASAVLWVAAANDAGALPDPVLDRFRVIEVPAMTPAQRIVVAGSIYAEANGRRRAWFDGRPHHDLLAKLATAHPRAAKHALEDAMARAAAEGRHAVTPDDVRWPEGRHRPRMGF